jgi:hypothetical protein
MNNEGKFEQRIKNLLFPVLVIFQVVFFAILMINLRIPNAHDGFDTFVKQYFFLNNAAIFHEIPQWIPFLTHGTSATWWYCIQSVCNPLTLLLLPIAFLVKAVNYFYVYHSGMFIDELILLVGTWCLAGRYFKSQFTSFFVATSIIGSSIWATQPFFNFYFYYTIPLTIFLLHRYFDTAKGAFLFLAISLCCIQIITSTTYVIPLSSLYISLYFFIYFLLHQSSFKKFLQTFQWNRSFVLYLFAAGMTLTVTMLLLIIGKDSGNMLMYNNDRNPIDGSVPLDVFLSYNAATGGIEWLDAILRFSSGADFSLFIGYLSLPLCIISIFCFKNPAYRTLLFLVIIMLLFAASTFISTFFYYAWPFMKFFRHLSLVAPVTKIFICFLAGFGLDYLISNKSESFRLRSLLYIAALVMILIIIYLVNFSSSNQNIQFFMQSFHQSGLLLYLNHFKDFDFIREHFNQSILILSLCVVIIFAVAVIKTNRLKLIIILLLLAVHMGDMYTYKIFEFSQRTLVLSPQELKVFQFEAPIYTKTRSEQTQQSKNRRGLIDKVFKHNISTYATVDLFTFSDKLDSRHITYNWQKSYNQFLKAYSGQDINEDTTPANDYHKGVRKLKFPLDNEAQLSIAGQKASKIQFFSKAITFNDEKNMATCLADPSFKGNKLFLKDNQSVKPFINCADLNLARSDRLDLAYNIKSYTANSLAIGVNNPSDKNVWMLYSDVWHPKWKVKVNDVEDRVYKADLGYKAVYLKPGKNSIYFYFKDIKTTLGQVFIALIAGGLVIGVIFLSVMLLFKPFSARLLTFLGREER